MSTAESDMLNYLRLAAVSSQKHQPLGQDRFLVLGGAAACRAGLLEIASGCRELILDDNPRHLIGHYATFPDALRDDQFTPLLKHLQQLCPPEQAEFLLHQQGVEEHGGPQALSAAQQAESLLEAIRRKP